MVGRAGDRRAGSNGRSEDLEVGRERVAVDEGQVVVDLRAGQSVFELGNGTTADRIGGRLVHLDADTGAAAA